ncbi:hypothetical protein HNR46_003494 [Haloferula luteola]|uniref:Uncharacterized protein n=1 Tax=Haloferula luteola TaxID=595692 RepID=A0A840VHE8_9BACT|nr:hypothetical protein [Haloferula luteola]MBB5353239.1 hypothetical protein [Haloferula luteola]
MKLRSLLALLSAILVLHAAAAPSTGPRHWNSQDGRTLFGTFVSADPEALSITIRRPNGTTVEIPVDQLAGEDIIFASKLVEASIAEAKAAELEKKKKKSLDGPLTFSLSQGSEDWPEDRKRMIVKAMEEAVAYFNENADFKKHVTANNSPGTPTADANYDGWINWGGSISRRVALHEIAHTLGIGTHWDWQKHIKDGQWTGKHAVAQLKEFDGPDAVLHADRMHFWPYGLNFDNESSKKNDMRFLKMVEAFRKDLGIR